MKERKKNKHKYSTIALLILLCIMLLGIGLGIDPRELDTVCMDNNGLLKRIDGVWQCYNESAAVYAEMWGQDIEVTIDAVDTYYNVTNMTLGSVSNVNFSNSTFTILTNGTYAINSQFSFSNGAINEFHLALGVNGIRELHCHTERKLGTGGDVGSASFTCIDNFTIGDELTVMVENTVSSSNPTIHDINLNVHLIGGAEIDYTESDPVWLNEKTYYVPYTGATTDVNLGSNAILMTNVDISNSFGANTATGMWSTAIGGQNIANATVSTAIGTSAQAFGGFSASINGKAIAEASTSVGSNSEARGLRSTAVGFFASATKENAVSVGYLAKAWSDYGVVIGNARGGLTDSKSIIAIATGETSYVNIINYSIGLGINNTEVALFTKDSANIPKPLVLGANTATGLSDGDLNASNIYYDSLVAKSPITLCSKEELKCFVIDTEAEKEYYITIDENYNILFSKNKEDKKIEEPTQKIKDKFSKLQEKLFYDQAKVNCLSQGQFYTFDGTCHHDTDAEAKEICHSDGWHVFVDGGCYENLYLKCQVDGGLWKFETNDCYIPPQAEPKAKTTQQLMQECYSDNTKKWEGNACVSII